jgi:hypothetical protein
MARADDDDDDDWQDRRNGFTPDIAVLAERQRDMSRRLRKLERKQGEVDTLMNKGIGGAALLVGLGVFAGWLFAVGGNVLRFLRGVG